MEDIKECAKKYNGSFRWLRDKIYFYQFDSTIAASGAKAIDFPSLYGEETCKLLPPVETKCVDIDVDVGVVPKKRIKVMVDSYQRQSNRLQSVQRQFKSTLEDIKEHGTGRIAEILKSIEIEQKSEARPAEAEVVSLSMSSPNEDSISESVKDQLYQFVDTQNNLKITVNKGRVEEDRSIVNISIYAKSRPDTMILKLTTVEMTPTPEPEEDTSHGSPTNGAKGATTENKKIIKGDAVGQTIAGAEKMAGEIAYEYMKKTGDPIRYIEVVSLLLDFGTNLLIVGFFFNRRVQKYTRYVLTLLNQIKPKEKRNWKYQTL